MVGGGIAGMQAASDLAESGFFVYLITSDDSLGGRMARLDKTFPTNECSMCLLGPRMTGSLNESNINLLTRAKLTQLEGEAGNFTAVVERQPRYVDEARCTGCGLCADTCPIEVKDEFNGELSKRKAVYKQFPQAVPNKYAIDIENCIRCMKCTRVCSAGAIDHQQQSEILNINIGAVILAPGFESFNAQQLGEYGLGYYSNVVSNIQFERMLSSTGPTGGHIYRPSDGAVPKQVAFIQCVGSRDCRKGYGNEYCSAVCCMASVKEAIIIKEHKPETEIVIFYLDMRAFGKNFDRYVNRAVGQGIKLQRSLISSVKEDPITGNLSLSYCDKGQVLTEEFDMVVLGAGVQPPKSAGELAKAAGIELNQFGFAKTSYSNPVETTRAGVFAAGGFIGPRDIPETVVSGSAAAAAAAELLSAARGVSSREIKYPEEKILSSEQARVGVFVCCCGSNIAGVVDVSEVVKYASGLPGVAGAWKFTYSCSQESLQKLKEIIHEFHLNRIVVAACSIRTHLPLFRNALREAGLNQYYLEMANIRDQCSWVHRDYPEEATAKAKDLVAMAVGKVRHHRPLYLKPVQVVQKALVVGGGIAGITAALSLAEQDYQVYLIERQESLGGMLNQLYLPQDGIKPRELIEKKIHAVKSHPNIRVYKNAELINVSGRIGDFQSKIKVEKTTIELKHGVVVIAAGCREGNIKEYMYGEDKRVITRLEMEEFLSSGNNSLVKTVVFIQCAGSRQEGREYCSRTCCGQTVRQALALKELNEDVNIYVLYRDMRTYGFMESEYRRAREKGVIFVNYQPDSPPDLQGGYNGINIKVKDPSSRSNLELTADLVVLASPAVPAEGLDKLAGLLKIPVNEDGFLVETHAKLAPLDVPTPGVFICGSAHSPQNINEVIAQAKGAAARAAGVLSKSHLLAGGPVAKVNQEKCAACVTCVRLCPYGVPYIGSKNVAEISPVQCQGCGTCAGACPNKAITLEHYRSEQLIEKVRAMFNMEVARSE